MVKQILRYLKGSVDLGITYQKDAKDPMYLIVDANFQAPRSRLLHTDEGRSSSEYEDNKAKCPCIIFHGGRIPRVHIWRSETDLGKRIEVRAGMARARSEQDAK